MRTQDFDYRIVLESPNGEFLPLIPQGALAGAEERLQEILDDPDTNYAKGWIERRANVWRTFSHARTPKRRQAS